MNHATTSIQTRPRTPTASPPLTSRNFHVYFPATLGDTVPHSCPLSKTPHWPAIVATIADACLYLGLPESLSIGPRWLLLAIMLFLLIPIVISHWRGHLRIVQHAHAHRQRRDHRLHDRLLVFLIQGLPQHREQPAALLRSAAGLWLTNILVFALWYWRLDAGGPARARAF